MNLCEALLGLVDLEFGPVLELLVDVFKGLHIIFWKLDTLPEILWRVGSLNCLHVEIDFT